MGADRYQLIEQAIEAKRVFFNALQGATIPSWIELDLSMAQLKGLFLLAHSGPTTVGSIASSLGVGQPAASILVERLVQGQFVIREDDRDDRRRTYVRLSRRGEALVEQLRQGAGEYYHRLLEQLPDDDLAALVRGLRALASLTPGDRCATRGADGRSREVATRSTSHRS